jgi:hypothetical protein
MAQYTHKTPPNHNPPYLSVYDIVYRYRTLYRCYYIQYRIQYRKRYRARCLMFQFEQGGLSPALDRNAADVITGSEHILKAFDHKHSFTATAIVDLIKNFLKNPEFNADDVDTDMLQRLQAAIDSGDLQVINMHKDGDGPQVLKIFARPVEKVLRELIGDLRLAGHQHFAFHEYKDPHGNRLFAGDANGAVSFQLAQIKNYRFNFFREKAQNFRTQQILSELSKYSKHDQNVPE